jgi:hypothetical protein
MIVLKTKAMGTFIAFANTIQMWWWRRKRRRIVWGVRAKCVKRELLVYPIVSNLDFVCLFSLQNN